MDQHFVVRLLARFRPLHGWLAFGLLAGVLITLAFSVLDVGWVPNDRVLLPSMAGGFFLAAFLAQRPIRPTIAWLILILLGVGLAFALVANLRPPLTIVEEGSPAVVEYWKIQTALLLDRAAGWLAAVRGGGRSTETIVFALGLAVAGWFVSALLAWSAYRLRRPWLGLTLVGFALAINTFYGQALLYWAVFYFGLAITAGTYLSHLNREITWEKRGIDFSSELRTDLLVYTAGISLGITSLAMAIPSINFRAIADAFQRQDAVVAAEQTMARAFAGVAQPRLDEGAIGGGGMPRSFLLGGGPELAETVVMTATLRADPPADLAAYHWRSVSFDTYTGRGWVRSPEREENFDRDQPLPSSDSLTGGRVITINQEVGWLYDRRASRYTLGRPVSVSHDGVAMWRGRDDLVGVRGRNNAPSRYSAETRLNLATPDELRAVRLVDIPPEIRARYTALPETVTSRVIDLAREITSSSAGAAPLMPYDQARAIETFLHQYTYSLDLAAPPAEADIVDYFLFDLQTGFCDYYASAMVVMARAVGLPARLGVGFLQQPPDAAGVQTIRQLDAHSWAEIYFASYGWVEFEPTAPFIVAPAAPVSSDSTEPAATFIPPESVAVGIPRRAPQREIPWLLLLGLAAAALVGWRLWGRTLLARFAPPDPALDAVQLAYAKLQSHAAALGRPPTSSQTPTEFAAYLLAAPELQEPEAMKLRPGIDRLITLFTARQYGPGDLITGDDDARATWAFLKKPLRRLVWRRRLGRLD